MSNLRRRNGTAKLRRVGADEPAIRSAPGEPVSTGEDVDARAALRRVAGRIRRNARSEATHRQALLAATAEFDGTLDRTDGESISGGAWDARQPRVHVIVEVFDGDQLLGTAVADEYRDDLRAAGKGDGQHGFTFHTPASLADRRPHLIDVRFAGSDRRLCGAPVRLVLADDRR